MFGAKSGQSMEEKFAADEYFEKRQDSRKGHRHLSVKIKPSAEVSLLSANDYGAWLPLEPYCVAIR